MSHLVEHPSGRCVEAEHLGANRSCTWLAGDFDSSASWELDGHELRELGLALSERAAKLNRARDILWAAGHPAEAERTAERLAAVRHVAEVFGVSHLHDLAPQSVVPAERI